MNGLTLHRLLGCALLQPGRARRRLADPSFAWERLIAAANEAYLTPALEDALRRRAVLAAIPAEVASYLAMIAERNRLRNARLRAQLRELVEALNRAGIVPVLLKGAAGLFADGGRFAASRIVTDLDLLIDQSRAADAVTVLAALGYCRLEGRAIGAHAVGDFIRDIDVGAVDLHVSLLNHPRLLPVADVLGRTSLREVDGLHARCLSPTDRVLHLLLHDLVQDQGLHDGKVNLRHLHEIATMMEAGAPVDWKAIAAHLSPYRLGTALDVALLVARDLFGTPLPPDARPSPLARLLAGRALLQLRYPRLARCGEIFGNAHRSLAWYRHADSRQRFPRLRRAADYLRAHRARTAGRILHVLLTHRT